ncbi:MAG: endo-1,4-beta-xylanase [Opitutaceae bacterium]|nr:endo-1,4-beta-xylanase [Opitutaceae bacterium]
MKTHHHLLLLILPLTFVLAGEGRAVSPFRAQSATVSQPPRADDPMSPAYYEKWSPEVQASIDRDIEKFRKAGAVIKLPANLPADADIKIEQLTHDFIFGAHIFNFNQLGATERNNKYKALFGTGSDSLFNSATIAFYWKAFERLPGKPRFAADARDTEEFWNNCANPKKQPHWRRPATDPVVEFCESKGIRLHGHPLVWGSAKYQWPDWIWKDFCPESEKQKLLKYKPAELRELPPEKLAELAPVYCLNLIKLQEKHIREIAEHYANRIHSWDVVNESSLDFHGNSRTGAPVTQSSYRHVMPGDYVWRAFETAAAVFPKTARLNINNNISDGRFAKQTIDLLKLGAKIDIMGSQMHLYNPQQCLDIAAGKPLASRRNNYIWPDTVRATMAALSAADLPIHLSEVTITAPGAGDPRGLEIQAAIARNLYRLWFSIEKMMGITWWNVVDGCGAPGQPNDSGLFTRDMQPKPAYHALNRLINHDWKTNLTIKNPGTGSVTFRGFKGKYKITCNDWTTTIHVQ